MSQSQQEMVLNWSSGKDAALAYYKLLNMPQYKVAHLLTTLSLEHERVFMHGIRETLLDLQADRMGLPLIKVKLPASPDDGVYKNPMKNVLVQLQQVGVTTAAYGDIFLEDLKLYREQQLEQIGMQAHFPLWQTDTRELVKQVEQAGIEAIIVCVNDKYLGKEFLGRKIDTALLNDLPDNVDPCGENGEYHSYVYNAPYFSAPIPIVTGDVVHRIYTAPNGDAQWDTGFYFMDCDLMV
jgi:uncharacterized protein (TIGR00290 family)